MADAGLNAVEKVLLAKLQASTALQNLVGNPIRGYNMLIPTRLSTFPVIVFQFMSSDFEGRAFSGDAESYDYLVKGVTTGAPTVVTAGDIAEGIDAALHGATLAPTGYVSIYAVKRQRWVRYVEQADNREPYMHAGAVYRLWAQRT